MIDRNLADDVERALMFALRGVHGPQAETRPLKRRRQTQRLVEERNLRGRRPSQQAFDELLEGRKGRASLIPCPRA